VTGDARWYRPVFSPRGILAVRALASDERPDAGARVPYYLQQTLGGSESLRGFSAYRFRARALATGSAEYRFLVSSFLDIGPFVDVGTVAPTFALLSVNNLEWSGGVRAGIRFKGQPLVTVGWGRSREGNRFFIGAATLF
jgi:outer membrane translocation and assembly module TamA